MAVLHVRNIPDSLYENTQAIADERGSTLSALVIELMQQAATRHADRKRHVKALIRIRKDLTKRKSGKRYDSFYLALSNRLNVPMITVDEKLAQGVVNQPFDVTLARNFRHSSP